MGRRRWNKNHPDKARAQQQQRPEDAGDPPVRLLALQPGTEVVAVGIGGRMTIVDLKTGEEVKLALPSGEAAPPASAAGAAAAPVEPVSPHAGCLRVMSFSTDGRSLLTGGDDKAARLWLTPTVTVADTAGGTPTWRCAALWRTPKKMSAGGFSLDSSFALFADKFGDVLVGRVPPTGEVAAAGAGAESQPQVPGTLLGHFCSIVTGVVPSPCSRFLATSDKDYKVRVSVLPSDLLQGSYEIQAYCMGHQDFVSCIAFVAPKGDGCGDGQAQQQQRPEAGSGSGAHSGSAAAPAVLVSGSGDGTVRLWDYVTGRQLSSYTASEPVASKAAAAAGGTAAEAGGGGAAAEARDTEEGPEEPASGGGDNGDDEGGTDGAREGQEEGGEGPSGTGNADGEGGMGEPQRRRKAPLCAPVLSLAVSDDGLTVAVVVEGEDELQLLAVDPTDWSLRLRQRLRWPDVRYPCQVAFGPAGRLWVVGGVPLPTARSLHLGVARPGPEGSYVPCTEEVLPDAVRSLLEARVPEEEAQMAQGGELFVYSKHLRKPEYDEETSLARKRMRNDQKETHRLAVLRQRQDEKAKQKQQGEQQQADAKE